MLLELRDFIKTQQSVSLTTLTRHFNTPAQVIEAMLVHWERKNVIIKQNPKQCNKRCNGCNIQVDTIYCYC
ncbi:FeoC-like transcriptional regulator [Spartinivicinus ruber]|uniref:FeoC-like transcriptional regulator n=1 Tax=Spartinivicinus ruber TaxID=2683272 RepID=UPI0013D3407F|nr:FeoC-like transcriptional regulator [Spartinivicinus ruber]